MNLLSRTCGRISACLLLLAAHFGEELGARLVEPFLDVAHADALLEARAEAATRNHTHLVPRRVEQSRALAHGRAGAHDEAGALARGGLLGELAQDALGADEAARRAT